MSKIKPEIESLATKLLKTFEVKVEGELGTVIHKEGVDAFSDNLPEGQTLKAFEEMDNYRYTYTAATGHAQGQRAIELMNKQKGLNSVTGTFNMGGKTEATHEIVRSKPVFNPKSGETSEKFGAMTTVVKTALGNQKIGQIGAVRAHIGELALSLAKGS